MIGVYERSIVAEAKNRSKKMMQIDKKETGKSRYAPPVDSYRHNEIFSQKCWSLDKTAKTAIM